MAEHSTSSIESSQKKNIQKTVIALIMLASMFVGLSVYKTLQQPDRDPYDAAFYSERNAILLKQPRALQGLTDLVDINGQVVDQTTFTDQWSLLFFGFTACPDVCPTTMSFLAKAVDAYTQQHSQSDSSPQAASANTKVQVYLVSVDPARDTPDKLKKYVQYFNPSFQAVTGKFLPLQAFAQQLNAAFVKVPLDGGSYTVDHSSHVAIINPKGEFHAMMKAPFKQQPVLDVLNALVSP